MIYEQFFKRATGHESGPYEYQRRLAEQRWPDLLDVPTGLGKTAAVVLAWLWKRRERNDPDTPHRLVYCLPMRVLVEQTIQNVRSWLRALDLLGSPGDGGVSVHLFMGGEPDIRAAHWAHYPEEDAVLIGTQDMLLSRALMRGYGMSRYQWPVHFALLHNDALWVYDEVQLMGAALPTSTQLEGLRRKINTGRPTRSLWVSATLHKDWLRTVDFRDHLDELQIATLTDEDGRNSSIQKRLSATKKLNQAQTCLDANNSKKKAARYIETLADEVAETHQSGEQTLVILNRVERAQGLYRALGKRLPKVSRLLLHARFRPAERRRIEQRLRDTPAESGRVIVATQAVEAGVDISSRVLFTELAPWSSLVQRFGRCNRAGEHNEAAIRWIDIADDANEEAPYEPAALAASRECLPDLRSASANGLPKVEGRSAVSPVLRRRDLLELFNTDPDLSGFDVDISPYIRDPGAAQAQVFWRDFDGRPTEDSAPARDELCPVGLGQLNNYLSKKAREAWTWDPLDERWQRIEKNRLRPGLVLLLRAGDGGYLEDQGFTPDGMKAVSVIDLDSRSAQERYSSDHLTMIGRYVALTEHLQDVAAEAGDIAKAIGLEAADGAILVEAARWHDVGKAHEAFQLAIRGDDAPNDQMLWAKSARSGIPNYRVLDENGEPLKRKGFRHELASMLAWLDHGERGEHSDLIAYLIAAHHGKVRMGLRALPTEKEPPDGETLYARGIWHGDRLPPVPLNGKTVPETTLCLDLMRLGDGPQGPSWTHRTRSLLAIHGPFRLAWLEALVRIADWRASRKEQEAR